MYMLYITWNWQPMDNWICLGSVTKLVCQFRNAQEWNVHDLPEPKLTSYFGGLANANSNSYYPTHFYSKSTEQKNCLQTEIMCRMNKIQLRGNMLESHRITYISLCISIAQCPNALCIQQNTKIWLCLGQLKL